MSSLLIEQLARERTRELLDLAARRRLTHSDALLQFADEQRRPMSRLRRCAGRLATWIGTASITDRPRRPRRHPTQPAILDAATGVNCSSMPRGRPAMPKPDLHELCSERIDAAHRESTKVCDADRAPAGLPRFQ